MIDMLGLIDEIRVLWTEKLGESGCVMQSGVAEKLDDVLRDKKAREELRELLRKGKSGRVTTADGKTYKVNTEVGGNRDS